ncbi:hypothetical protein ACM66B_005503 [Microbotryomycetes sp. NB124-2]
MRVRVAYDAVPSMTDYSLVRADVQRQLPLRNLHWVRRTGANRTIRTIQALNVEVKPRDAFGPAVTALPLLERPYAYVLFVVCDDNDVYRAAIRPQIKEWLDAVTQRPHHEWLIVHVTKGRNSGTKFYQRKGAVIDKIKADFNTTKRDRCLQVAQAASAEDPTAWAEFQNKLKEVIVATFDSNVSLYEEDIRRADSQRQLEGWQYLPFFRQKEALADSFEAMTLVEDALVQYDELEALFFQALKERENAGLQDIGGLALGDDASPLLSLTKKPYRRLIQSDAISVFDFRVYLFARQAALLFMLGRVEDVARRGGFFISTFARTLRENSASLGKNFLESWTYSACLNIVDECQKRVDSQAIDRATSRRFVAAKAELLELARKQLDKIGIDAGHLPSAHPFSMSLNERSTMPSSPASNDAAKPPIARAELTEAIKDSSRFDVLYLDVTNRCIDAYQASGRKRCSLKLHASLAALERHRARWSASQTLFAQLPAHYVDLRWVKIEAILLESCTSLQAHLNMTRERLLSTLALIRAGMGLNSPGWTLEILESADAQASIASRLLQDVRDLSKTLSKDFAAIAFPTFSIAPVGSYGTVAEEEDGVVIQATVTCLLPCPVQLDEVRLKFTTSDGEQVWFTAGPTLLSGRETSVSAFSPRSVTGRLALELSQLRFSRIIFQYSHRPVSARNLAPDPRNLPINTRQPVLYFQRDFRAVDVWAEGPQRIDLRQSRHVVLCISTGRNRLNKLVLSGSCNLDNVSLAFDRAQIVSPSSSKEGLSVSPSSVELSSLRSQSVTKIEVPIWGLPDGISAVPLELSADYSTDDRPTAKRSLRRTFNFSVALPLAINVQDFFRNESVLSKFTLTAEGQRGLRIRSPTLKSSDDVIVQACGSQTAEPTTILPLQTANYTFRVKGWSAQRSKSLTFSLTFCTVDEELRARVREAVERVALTSDLAADVRWFNHVLTSDIIASTNIVEFATTGRFGSLALDEHMWRTELDRYFGERAAQAWTVVQKILQTLEQFSPATPASAWKDLSLPVHVPELDILTQVRCTTNSTETELGRPMAVVYCVSQSTQWSKSGTASGAVARQFRFSLTARPEDWVVSGVKKGLFALKSGDEHTLRVTVIPLHAGTLFLPVLQLSPADDNISHDTHYVNAAAHVEVLPAANENVFVLGPTPIVV